MAIEVELKFPLDAAPPTAEDLSSRLVELGAAALPPRRQRDCYYAHPQRDFAVTDEALRIRDDQGRIFLTYKGPLLDPLAKTRRELETGLESAEVAAEIFEMLGFRPVRVVAKHRRPFHLTWQEVAVEAVIDEVDDLGTFVELETITDEAGHEAARDQLLALASNLGLEHGERRSYLGLLLARDEESTNRS